MHPRELANSICDTLQRHGYQAFLVGGCVRDILLGREPADFDVTTDARPEQVLQLFPDGLAVGAQFGVVLISRNASKVEVAVFRHDVGYSDGRHPDQVVYAKTPQEDVSRRDFTINGLLMDPLDGNRVLDFVGGRDDLQAGIIRAIGDPERRFAEDKLRMLRAVRFAARFSYRIEEGTYSALCAQAGEIGAVSAERIRDELTRILTQGGAGRGFVLLEETGLLGHVLPEIACLRGVQQPPEFHPEGDVWTHTLLLLEQLPTGASATLAWGALLHDVGKPSTFAPPRGPDDRIRFDGHVEVGTRMAEEIARRLRFSGEETERVAALVAQHLRFKDVFEMRPATLKRFVRQPHFQEHLDLHRMDCLASHGKLDAYEFVRKFVEETPAEAVRPARLVTGDDLKSLGLVPGPGYREILNQVEEAQLEGRVRTREEAMQFVREHCGAQHRQLIGNA